MGSGLNARVSDPAPTPAAFAVLASSDVPFAMLNAVLAELVVAVFVALAALTVPVVLVVPIALPVFIGPVELTVCVAVVVTVATEVFVAKVFVAELSAARICVEGSKDSAPIDTLMIVPIRNPVSRLLEGLVYSVRFFIRFVLCI